MLARDLLIGSGNSYSGRSSHAPLLNACVTLSGLLSSEGGHLWSSIAAEGRSRHLKCVVRFRSGTRRARSIRSCWDWCILLRTTASSGSFVAHGSHTLSYLRNQTPDIVTASCAYLCRGTISDFRTTISPGRRSPLIAWASTHECSKVCDTARKLYFSISSTSTVQANRRGSPSAASGWAS